jgi:hypothetical protein
MLDHVSAGRFGTFLYNCERERQEAELKSKTVSLWTYMLSPLHVGKYTNTFFRPHPTKHRLVPNTSAKFVQFWEAAFLRHDKTFRHSRLRVHALGYQMLTSIGEYQRLKVCCFSAAFVLTLVPLCPGKNQRDGP